MKKIAVLYHANCPDGFGGAWAAWKKFGSKAEYYPVRYNFPPPELKDKDVYTVDFCYNEPEFLEKLKKKNKSLTIIDHHPTAKDNVKISTKFILDLDHSGAVLAWKFFHKGSPVPLLLKHIEDMDLWRFRMKNTKVVVGLLDLVPMNFREWDNMIAEFEDEALRRKYLEKGKLLLQHQDSLMDKIIQKATQFVRFHGYKTYALNTPVFDSELGARLYEKLPPMAIIWYENQDGIKVSLRSDGSVNVGKIAQKYGGGGHVGASGFRLPKGAKVPWTTINDGKK